MAAAVVMHVLNYNPTKHTRPSAELKASVERLMVRKTEEPTLNVVLVYLYI